MDKSALEHVQKLVEDEVKKRFPDAPVQRVALLQYGDDPVVEPGELAIRVYIDAGAEAGDRERVAHDFGQTYREALETFRKDLSEKLPEARLLQIHFGDDKGGPGIFLARPPRSLEARALAGGDLTPVMARLAPTDLETLDTLITSGIASNRADAVRWALARIRERPAYARLRERALEIEELKTQF